MAAIDTNDPAQTSSWWDAIWTDITNWTEDRFFWMSNKIIELVGALMDFVIGILPDWSFDYNLSGGVSVEVLKAINWVLPIGLLIDMVGLYMLSVTSYFTIGILMRWLRISN